MEETKKILVIGDSCYDLFYFGTCERLCPEAPVPVFKELYVKGNNGMASNVFENIKALGCEVDIITNAGDRPTKVRYIDEVSNQMLLRVDNYDNIPRIKNINEINFSQYYIVVISDYNKGYLQEEDIKYICSQHDLVFLDTKKKIGKWAAYVSLIKINEKEYKENSYYLNNNYTGNLIVTLGKNGTKYINNGNVNYFTIENEHPVRDLSGAGDTFFAGLVADYIVNNDIYKAIKFANKCASWAVTQKGVSIIDKEKI